MRLCTSKKILIKMTRFASLTGTIQMSGVSSGFDSKN